MAKIVIEKLYDESDCELCGGDYAYGANVYIDGSLALEFDPVAHCYDSRSYELDHILSKIISHLGHSVEYMEE